MNLEISTEDLRKVLRSGVVNFEFEKKNDGTLRQAKGTLSEELIPKSKIPKENNDEDGRSNGKNLKYWDIEKEAWRSLSAETKTVKLI